MVWYRSRRIRQLRNEIKRLQEENQRLKEAQKRCTECENFNQRRNFADEQIGSRPPEG